MIVTNKPTNFDWCNNDISQRLAKDYPHDFSICDVDGIVRKEYILGYTHYTRFIVYESKHERELFSLSQLKTLSALSSAVDWKKFDRYSGVYGIRHNDDLTTFRIYNITDNQALDLGTMNGFDSLYQWFSKAPKQICQTI